MIPGQQQEGKKSQATYQDGDGICFNRVPGIACWPARSLKNNP